ncbi:hypothetical protein U879_16955 [Defluviimonas sp. 20V17]|uniref:Uncharacterized protein n=1 Tax=Allgaiera indica TaxID=765699 RepID=A0AAN4UN63_9RHOB|nr:hypothetical protein [Allgaiera indica]KDB02500.1 hypothetical protein U879_16955 [Defluviimonas sp. 20V17]GHD98741.1 hypothetical protein GCM10008024_03470 [Allgaiera indica]SDW07229.1 hypothetical protein SAMN05444006_101202 [Allgaiera indica]
MQTIKGYLASFLAVLAGVTALWLGTLVFFTLLACSAAAAIAYWLGTGPRPITLRLPRDHRRSARPGPGPDAGPGPATDRSTRF